LRRGRAVLVGAAAGLHGRGEIHEHILIATLLAALLIQIGTNFANDVFDFAKAPIPPSGSGPCGCPRAAWSRRGRCCWPLTLLWLAC